MVASAPELTPRVVVFSGPPGTGKSTLADEIARDLGAPVVSWDWFVAGLTSFPDVQTVLDNIGPDVYFDVGYSLMSQCVEKQLRNAQSVVLDGVIRERAIAAWRVIADAHKVPVFVVESVCSDADVHRPRIEGRTRAIPGWHELDWDSVAKSSRNYRPLAGDKLVLDAVESVADNLARVRAYVQGDKS